MEKLLSFLKPYLRPGMERRRALMTIFGVLTGGLSVGLFKESNFGVDPFQCLCAGLDNAIPIDFGTLYVIINAVLLLVVFFLDRHYISLGTFINLFLLGYVVQFSQNTLHAIFGDPTMEQHLLRLHVHPAQRAQRLRGGEVHRLPLPRGHRRDELRLRGLRDPQQGGD